MTLELVRIGWPNTAVIVALAAMPVIALTTPPPPRPAAIEAGQIEPATKSAVEAPATVAMVGVPGAILE